MGLLRDLWLKGLLENRVGGLEIIIALTNGSQTLHYKIKIVMQTLPLCHFD